MLCYGGDNGDFSGGHGQRSLCYFFAVFANVSVGIGGVIGVVGVFDAVAIDGMIALGAVLVVVVWGEDGGGDCV